MKFLFFVICFLVVASPSWAYKLEVRTHDQRNPFYSSSVTIVDEGGRSWRSAPWSPIVLVVGSDPSNSANWRDGTGFFVAKYHDGNSQGVLVLTDYHVLPVTPTPLDAAATDPNITIRFFDQEHRTYNGVQKGAKAVAVSSFADLVVLKVALTADEMNNVILPPLAVVDPKYFENNFWTPMAFKINPPENLTKIIGYTTDQSLNVTNMTTIDAVNSLSPGVDMFWNIPGNFQQGMSGGPLVGMNVVDQAGHALNQDLDAAGKPINYTDVFFGALGFIYDVDGKNGYAYPFSRYFIDMMNAAPAEDLTRKETIALPQNSLFTVVMKHQTAENASVADATYYIHNPVITAFAQKRPTDDRVVDGVVLNIDGCTAGSNPGAQCDHPVEISLYQEIDLNQQAPAPSGSGTPGSGGNGTPGSGGNGTPGSNGGNGTPGTAGGNSSPRETVAHYEIFLTPTLDGVPTQSSVISFYTAPGLNGLVPIRYIKELLSTLLSTHFVEVTVADGWYANGSYDFDSYERASRTLEDPLLLNDINLSALGKLFADFPTDNATGLTSPLVSGRFVGTKPDSKVISGRVDIKFGANQPGEQYTLEWRVSLLQVAGAWDIQKSDFTLNNRPLQLKSHAPLSVIPDFPNGRLRLTLKSGQVSLGTVWP